jgi:uncharacterized damage-inducible protein DinB
MEETMNKSKHVFSKSMTVLLFTALLIAGSSSLAFAEEEAKGGKFGNMFLSTWESATKYSLEMAKTMPEDLYTFKPTPEIMSFAEQNVHTAGVIMFFASKIKGTEPPKDRPKAEGMSKQDIFTLLKKAFAAGKDAIVNLSDEEAHKKVHLWGDVNLKKALVVFLMRDHTTHHRGQMIIYLRLKGKKPPQYSGF